MKEEKLFKLLWALIGQDGGLVLFDWSGVPAIFATKKEAAKWAKENGCEVRKVKLTFLKDNLK